MRFYKDGRMGFEARFNGEEECLTVGIVIHGHAERSISLSEPRDASLSMTALVGEF